MSSKPNRILLIEPDSTRLERMRSILADRSSALEFQAVSSLTEVKTATDGFPPALVFSALPLQKHPNESGGKAETENFDLHFPNFAHALRGSLGVILNAVFLLKRKGAEDRALLEKYLEVIEQEAVAAEQLLSDFARSAK